MKVASLKGLAILTGMILVGFALTPFVRGLAGAKALK